VQRAGARRRDPHHARRAREALTPQSWRQARLRHSSGVGRRSGVTGWVGASPPKDVAMPRLRRAVPSRSVRWIKDRAAKPLLCSRRSCRRMGQASSGPAGLEFGYC
jgi:hypothetical protein